MGAMCEQDEEQNIPKHSIWLSESARLNKLFMIFYCYYIFILFINIS